MTLWRIRVCGMGWMVHLVSTTEPIIEYTKIVSESGEESILEEVAGLIWTPIEDKTMTDNLLSVDWEYVILVSYRETTEKEVYRKTTKSEEEPKTGFAF